MRRGTRRTERLRCGLAILAILGSSGCYGYFESAPETIKPGEQVRVVLSDTRPQRVVAGALRAQSTLEGELVGLTPDSAAVAVWIGQAYTGTEFEAAHQTITLPREQILGFQRRELSEWRTVAAGVAVLGLAAVLIAKVAFTEDPNPGGISIVPPPPPNDGAVVIRLRHGFRIFPVP